MTSQIKLNHVKGTARHKCNFADYNWELHKVVSNGLIDTYVVELLLRFCGTRAVLKASCHDWFGNAWSKHFGAILRTGLGGLLRESISRNWRGKGSISRNMCVKGFIVHVNPLRPPILEIARVPLEAPWGPLNAWEPFTPSLFKNRSP